MLKALSLLLTIISSLFLLLFAPLAYGQDTVLFSDDFSDGDMQGWDIVAGNWYINNGNLVGSNSGRSLGGRINTNDPDWDNYSLDLDVNSFQGIDQGIGIRYSDTGSYEVNLRYGTGAYDTPQVKLWKKTSNGYIVLTDTHSFPLINNKWYHLKIEAFNENIKVWIDNTLIFDLTDAGTGVKKGTLSLSYSTGDISIAYMRFDNIKVTMAPLPSSKTPLILIPGIGGSELKVAEDTIWNKDNGHGGIFNHAYGKDEKVWVNEGEAAALGDDDYFDILRMKADGITSEAKIETTGNLYAGAYQETINFFTDNGYTLNQDLFVFPYDWRKDLTDTSKLLDQKIQQIKQQTNSQKVDIVAHSMGGLVARSYIADPQKAQNVRKLFTLGTPHLGAAKFLKAVRYGDCIIYNVGPFCLSIAPSELNDVLQNFISGFQLAPSQAYFTFYSGEDSRHLYPYRTESGDLNYNQIKDFFAVVGHNTSLFNPSEIFHSVDATLPNTNGVDVFIVVGSGKPTLGQIVEQTITTLNGDKIIYKDQININGDKTVPLLSASISDPHKGLFLNGLAQVYYTNQEHKDLVVSGPTLNLLKNVLDGNNQIPNGISIEPYKLSGHGLSVHSPVNIHVYDSLGNHTGFVQGGDFEAHIPGSSYDSLDDAKFIFLPDNGVYNVKFEATNQGSFDFKIREFDNNENTKTILYKEIPLTYNTKAETTFDTSLTQTPVLQIDEDGNGTFDTQTGAFSTLAGTANFDYTPPVINVDVNPKTIWPVNNKMVDVNISGTVTDQNPYLTKIVVNDEYGLVEPEATINQAEINQVIKLEASRKGDDKDGRIYQIKILATDLAGNTSLSTFEVTVLHDQRDKK